jgi:hypothetical protein
LSKPIRKEKEALPYREFKPLLPLDLQLFADDDPEDDPEDDPDDDPDDDTPDLDELLKDPKFKKKYQAKMKEQLGKRLKKYKDVDPEEYRRLKEQADKGKKKDDNPDDDTKKKDVEKLLRAERREKRAAIKEFAVDNGYNQKLLARLIDTDAVELDEDGEPVNLDDLFEEIQEEFPEYFSEEEEDDEDEDDEDKKKKSKSKAKSKTFKPGTKQKGNKQKKVDVRARGAERAKARHKKEE